MAYNYPQSDLRYKYDLDITYVRGGAHVAKLSRDNYSTWRLVTQGMMEKANCWGIILDQSLARPDTYSPDAFKRAFRVAKDIVFQSCSDYIKRGIDHGDHPRQMWLALEVQFHTSPEAIARRRAINAEFKLSKPIAGIPISDWLRHLLLLQKLVMFSDMMILNDALLAQMAGNLPPGPYSDTFWRMKAAGNSPKRIIEAIRDRELRNRNMRTCSQEMRPWCSYHQQSDDHTSQECRVLQGHTWVKIKNNIDGIDTARFRRASLGSRALHKSSDDVSTEAIESPKCPTSVAGMNQGALHVKEMTWPSTQQFHSSTMTTENSLQKHQDGYGTKKCDPSRTFKTWDFSRFDPKGQGKAPQTPPKPRTPTADWGVGPITPPPPKGYWGYKPASDEFPPQVLVSPMKSWCEDFKLQQPGRPGQTKNELVSTRGRSWRPATEPGKTPNPLVSPRLSAPAPVRAPVGARSPPLQRCCDHQRELGHTSENCPTLKGKMAERRARFYGYTTPRYKSPKYLQTGRLLTESATGVQKTAPEPNKDAATNTLGPSPAHTAFKINIHPRPSSPKVLNKDGKLVTPPHLRHIRKTPPDNGQDAQPGLKLDDVPPIEELYIGEDGYMRRREPRESTASRAHSAAPKTPSPKTSSPKTPSTARRTDDSDVKGKMDQGNMQEPQMKFIVGPDGWMRAVPVTPTTPFSILNSSLRPKIPGAEQVQLELHLPAVPTSQPVPHIPDRTSERKSNLQDVSVLRPSPPRESTRQLAAIAPPRQAPTPPASLRIRRINAFCLWYDHVRNRNDNDDEEEFAMAALSVAHHVMTREDWELEDIALFSQHDWDRHIEYHPAMMVMTRAVATYLACLARGIIRDEVQDV